ncbi:MAG: HWE histidine kinase domain-containing protein [Terricaulis sp.]
MASAPHSTRQTDLTNCDREPIHIPGTIQPHGCMLVCDEGLTTIRRASANASAFLSLDIDDLIGCPLSDVLGDVAAHELRNALASSPRPQKPGLLLSWLINDENSDTFDAAVHRFKGNAIVEFEKSTDGQRGPIELARTLVSTVSTAADIQTLLARVPRLLRGALGYDRVMVYQFAHDGSGAVVSEAKRGDLESFLGQHFPASDIPQQARALYLQNTIRIISDASGAKTDIRPVLDASGEPLDLSFAHLRSVSPIHLEYLRNMGVGASMSISIVVAGELWGLIACHHYSRRTLSMAQRTAAEMFGEFFSMQLETLIRKNRLETATHARQALDGVMRNVAYRGDIIDSLRDKVAEFEGFMPCDGVGLWLNGTWTSAGTAAPGEHIPALMKFLTNVSLGRVWATNELASSYDPAKAFYKDAAGVLAIPLSQIPRDYLVFFRCEVTQSVNWAGAPGKVYETGPMGDRLTPRKSFALWKQEVSGQSPPWTEEDREMAEAARGALLEVIMRHNEILETERQTADLRQKLLNEELNHRVKNILSLIKSLVSQPVEDGKLLADYVATLKGRIMALANAHDQVIRSDGGGSLRGLLSAELGPYNAQNVSIEGAAIDLDTRAYSVLALVMHELATNAAKYGALSAPAGKLAVSWSLTDDKALAFSWKESGGPPVTPPTRRGFGSILLHRSIPFDLGGQSEISYSIEGVEAHFVIPANFVRSGRAENASAAPASAHNPADQGLLKGCRILLVEDQLVIAIDVETMLAAAGAGAIETAATGPEALRLLTVYQPDICVLDVNLGSGTSLAVADELVKRKIPFIFATGYADRAIIPKRHAGVHVIRKPYEAEDLVAALALVLRRVSPE